ncbi:hypothetical protein A2W14_01850 [Candidatus Gottesmanbacteria bacterium RBG_16_37_8]|uniref:Chorismate mutase domain-containing protein n=1 Tax=Candidatus Gottesmanbacteria bacterium RBG_16_37_8 TaxID=1798371 RepID=A0A1F5YTW4_9BACT|nr:MAG: hypothetical protein A2W14_01850 [Candidatus Gottesmanbacteria bacterium RBG_16_37_8]
MIDILRRKINRIDEQLIRLLGKRMSITGKIKKTKIKKGRPIADIPREKDLLKFWQKIGRREKLHTQFILNLFNLIINESKRVQNEK